MDFLPASDSDPNAQAKRELESALIDTFADLLHLKFDPTVDEIGGVARDEYLRGRINAAKDKLEKLKRIQQREKAVVARRKEIERDNASRRKSSRP